MIRACWRAARWSLAGSVGAAAIATLAYNVHLSFATASFCFLLLLVLLSLSGDFVAALVVSLLAVGCLDYFFTQPLFTFEVASPFDLLGLLSFLATGLIITRLVT